VLGHVVVQVQQLVELLLLKLDVQQDALLDVVLGDLRNHLDAVK
jgi:hypothetical protein